MYLVTNLKNHENLIKDFIKTIDPNEKNVFDKCQSACEICLLDIA